MNIMASEAGGSLGVGTSALHESHLRHRFLMSWCIGNGEVITRGCDLRAPKSRVCVDAIAERPVVILLRWDWSKGGPVNGTGASVMASTYPLRAGIEEMSSARFVMFNMVAAGSVAAPAADFHLRTSGYECSSRGEWTAIAVGRWDVDIVGGYERFNTSVAFGYKVGTPKCGVVTSLRRDPENSHADFCEVTLLPETAVESAHGRLKLARVLWPRSGMMGLGRLAGSRTTLPWVFIPAW